MPEKLDVLAFGAHPDDAEAACGGLLARLARRGYKVGICDLTRGELASNGTPEERAAEAHRAARVLGVAARVQLGLPDGSLDAGDGDQTRALVRLLRQRRPRLVVAPHAGGRHPDHAEAGALVRRARFFCGVWRFAADEPAVPRPELLQALDDRPFEPSFVVDITDELALKLDALRCYRSQFERQPGGTATHINDPAYLQRIEMHARVYGQRIGRAAGEPFRIQGCVPVDDPVALLAPEARATP